jgi:hypothetical protein
MKTIDLFQLTKEVEPLIKIEWVTPTVMQIAGARMVTQGGTITQITTYKNHDFNKGDRVYIHGVEDDLIKGFFEVKAVEKTTTFTIEHELKRPFRGGDISLPKTYSVFGKDDLPVKHFARYNKAQAEMMQALDLVSPTRAKATLAKAVSGNLDEDDAGNELVQGLLEKVGESDSISWGDLATYATKQLEQSCAMLEALAQMPDGLLVATGIPSSVVAEVYAMVQSAVDAGEPEESEDGTEGKTEIVEKKPSRRKAKAKEPEDSTTTTSTDS